MAHVDASVDSKLQQVLQSERSQINEAVDAVRRVTQVDTQDVMIALSEEVIPLLHALVTLDEQRATPQVAPIIGLAAELTARKLLGPKAIKSRVAEFWRAHLPQFAPVILGAEVQVLRSLTNAVARLGAERSVNFSQWLELTWKVARLGGSTPVFLQGAQVAAWRSGLAVFRDQALGLCNSLDQRVVASALDLPDGADVVSEVTRLHRDRWYAPGASADIHTQTRVSRVGGFRGFGDAFLQPPVLAVDVDELIARDPSARQGAGFLIAADSYGAMLLPHQHTTTDYQHSVRTTDTKAVCSPYSHYIDLYSLDTP